MKIHCCSIGVLSCAITVSSLGLVPEARAQQPQSIFLEGDMVRGNTGKGQTGATCVLSSQFKRDENAVFRVRVRDIFGQPLDDKVVATDLQGRTQTWQSFQDPRSQIVIIPGGVEYSGTPQAPR